MIRPRGRRIWRTGGILGDVIAHVPPCPVPALCLESARPPLQGVQSHLLHDLAPERCEAVAYYFLTPRQAWAPASFLL